MCTRPKLIDVGLLTGKKHSQYKFAPCNMCIECRNMRREEYTQRLKHEIQTSSYIASFVTLTYRDEELPLLFPEGSAVVGSYFGSVPPAYGSTLSRSEAKQFCDKLTKRFRRKFGKDKPFKYICAGEYGDDGHRPHYHLIIVGLPASERKMVYEAWNKGRVDIEPVGNGAIRYVLSYIDKQVFGADQLYETYGDFQPPFCLFSKGIGEQWIQKNLHKFDDYGTIKFGSSGKKYTLNPYYRNKYQFKTKEYTSPFSESVVKWAEFKKLNLLDAYIDRCKLMEQKYQRHQVKRREPLYRCTKAIIRKEIDRQKIKQNDFDKHLYFSQITKALLKCDDDYLLEIPDLINKKVMSSNWYRYEVFRKIKMLDNNDEHTVSQVDRIQKMIDYNRLHKNKRGVKFIQKLIN